VGADEPTEANTMLVTKTLPQDVANLVFVPSSHCVVSSRLFIPQESTYISGAKIAHRLSFEIACCVMSQPLDLFNYKEAEKGWKTIALIKKEISLIFCFLSLFLIIKGTDQLRAVFK